MYFYLLTLVLMVSVPFEIFTSNPLDEDGRLIAGKSPIFAAFTDKYSSFQGNGLSECFHQCCVEWKKPGRISMKVAMLPGRRMERSCQYIPMTLGPSTRRPSL